MRTYASNISGYEVPGILGTLLIFPHSWFNWYKLSIQRAMNLSANYSVAPTFNLEISIPRKVSIVTGCLWDGGEIRHISTRYYAWITPDKSFWDLYEKFELLIALSALQLPWHAWTANKRVKRKTITWEMICNMLSSKKGQINIKTCVVIFKMNADF